MSKWYIRYVFPVSFPLEPIHWHDPLFNQLFIRTNVYDDLDRYIDNIHAQHGKFWISSSSGGYGKSTMLHYIARRLYSEMNSLKALPFHIFVGIKSRTVEHTFIKSFLNEFMRLSENLSKANKILRTSLSSDMKKYVFDEFDTYRKEIREFREKLAVLNVEQMRNKFYDVLDKVLKPWTRKGIFSKYVLLIDEMDKLETTDILSFLAENQHLFERLYQEYKFVAFLSGHKSWVERIRDGTEYSYYHGKIFGIPPFLDLSDIQKLIETRLAQYLHMVSADSPWAMGGYEKLRELTGGVPRMVLQLASEATNEAQDQNLAKIGSGIVEEVLVKEEYTRPIEEYFKSNIETFIKLKRALDKHIDSLLYIFYNMPGHQILKEYDHKLSARTRYLGVELSDEKWFEKVNTLVRFDCLSESFATRELSKDLCDLFDIFSKHPALMHKVVPTIVRELGDLEPVSGDIIPPNYQEIINRVFQVSSNQWFDKEELCNRFADSTAIQAYIRITRGKHSDELLRERFEKEFKTYVKITPDLMIIKEDDGFYYRHLPKGMNEEDYSVLKKMGREVLDNYIDLVVKPTQYDSDTIGKLDQLIENILRSLAGAKKVQFEHGCLHKKSKHRIFRELGLDTDLRRHLEFYIRESKSAEPQKPMIQAFARDILLDLGREIERTHKKVWVRIKQVSRELIEKGEDEKTEFKSSMRWNYDTGEKDSAIEFEIAKTVSAFMNSEGGHLLIGVSDDKHILGIENDFKVIRKPDQDGYELHFTGIVNKFLGKENRPYAKMFFETLDGKTIAVVEVIKSPDPVYMKSKGNEEFYVRLGNSSQPLGVREATKYIKNHWPDR